MARKPPLQIDWIDADKKAQPKGYKGAKARLEEKEDADGIRYIRIRHLIRELHAEEYRLKQAFLEVQGDLFKDLAEKDAAKNAQGADRYTNPNEAIKIRERERAAQLRKEEETAALWKIAAYVTRHGALVEKTETFLDALGEQDLSGKLRTWRLNARAVDTESRFCLFWEYLNNSKIDVVTDEGKAKWLDHHARHYARTGEDPVRLLKFHAGGPVNRKKEGWEELEKDQRELKDLIDVFKPFTKSRLTFLADVQSALDRHRAPMDADFAVLTDQIMDMLPKKGGRKAPPPAPSQP